MFARRNIYDAITEREIAKKEQVGRGKFFKLSPSKIKQKKNVKNRNMEYTLYVYSAAARCGIPVTIH